MAQSDVCPLFGGWQYGRRMGHTRHHRRRQMHRRRPSSSRLLVKPPYHQACELDHRLSKGRGSLGVRPRLPLARSESQCDRWGRKTAEPKQVKTEFSARGALRGDPALSYSVCTGKDFFSARLGPMTSRPLFFWKWCPEDSERYGSGRYSCWGHTWHCSAVQLPSLLEGRALRPLRRVAFSVLLSATAMVKSLPQTPLRLQA